MSFGFRELDLKLNVILLFFNDKKNIIGKIAQLNNAFVELSELLSELITQNKI